MKMWLHYRCVPCVLLAILVQAQTLIEKKRYIEDKFNDMIAPPESPIAPPEPTIAPPPTIPEQLATLLETLNAIHGELDCVLNITDDQCPCLEEVKLSGDETFADVECFETKFEIVRNNLNALITFVESLDANVSTACPERTGSVFVAACDSPDIAVVDPNGFIQNGFQVTTNVTDWTLGPFDIESFEFDYFGSEPFTVRCLILPDGTEVVLGSSSDAPLSTTAVGTGIAYFEPTDEVYVAMTFQDTSMSGIYAFNRTSAPQIRLVFPYPGTTGRIFVSGSTVYMIVGRTVQTISTGETTWTQLLIYPVDIISLIIQDDGTVVFCEETGFVVSFNPTARSFTQLNVPTVEGFNVCGDIAVNPCDGLVYVAVRDEEGIEIFNSTAPPGSTEVQSLGYTLNVPTTCPSLLFDPRACI